MADQPPLNDVLMGETVKQMQDVSREEILRQIFGDIGELADDFTCAVESTVLLHGRMYITNRFICFYSNLFGLEKKIRIPYSHIRSISKENTAMVIPNAIAISTDKKDYTFRSFWDREDCFRILTAFLNKFRGLTYELPPPSKNRPPRDRNSMGTVAPGTPATIEAGVAAESGGDGSPTASSDSVKAKHMSLPLPKKNPSTTSGNSPTGAVGTTVATPTSTVSDSMDGEFESDTTVVTEKAGSGVDMATIFAAEIAKCTQKLAVVTGETLQISVKDFADLVVEENAPYSFKWYHESVKDNSLVVTPWTEMPGAMGFGREIKFFKPVNLPGLASTRGVKLQKYRKFDDLGLIVCSSTRLEDVPCADSFSVEDTIVIRRVDANTVTIDISFCVLFLKSTMMKYIIERSTNVEMAKWLEVFFKHLKKITDLKKEGKLTYPTDSAAGATPAITATPEPVAAAVAPEASTAVAVEGKGRGAGTLSDGFLAMLSFKDEAVGDQLKFGICILFILYLVVNYIRWQMIANRLQHLEEQLKALDALAREALMRKAAGSL